MDVMICAVPNDRSREANLETQEKAMLHKRTPAGQRKRADARLSEIKSKPARESAM